MPGRSQTWAIDSLCQRPMPGRWSYIRAFMPGRSWARVCPPFLNANCSNHSSLLYIALHVSLRRWYEQNSARRSTPKSCPCLHCLWTPSAPTDFLTLGRTCFLIPLIIIFVLSDALSLVPVNVHDNTLITNQDILHFFADQLYYFRQEQKSPCQTPETKFLENVQFKSIQFSNKELPVKVTCIFLEVCGRRSCFQYHLTSWEV